MGRRFAASELNLKEIEAPSPHPLFFIKSPEGNLAAALG